MFKTGNLGVYYKEIKYKKIKQSILVIFKCQIYKKIFCETVF